MITKITTEVYETKNDDFAALVVFRDQNGDRVSYEKEFFGDKFSAQKFAYDTAFAGRDVKKFGMATRKSTPGWREYEMIG